MKNNVKPGDLIFLIDRVNNVRLVKYVSNYGSKTVEAIDIETDSDYLGYGFAATPENRDALTTLYGEDAVPKLPLRGSEFTKAMLKEQEYVLCWVSDESDNAARENKELVIKEYMDANEKYFVCVGAHAYGYAVPVDMNGIEIVENYYG